MQNQIHTKTKVQKIIAYWDFYVDNFKLAITIIFFGFALIALDFVLKFKFNYTLDSIVEQVLISIASGAIVIGFFDIIYEIKTREKFIDILSQINQTFNSGVIVHTNHNELPSRKSALEKYLKPKGIIRIITTTADNYIKIGEEVRRTIEDKVKHQDCSVYILLQLPINNANNIKMGQRSKMANEIILEHQVLYDDYLSLININKDNVIIKFYTVPLHFNALIIGENRLYGAPIMYNTKGRDLPSYEMFPSSQESIFYKYLNEFDYLFTHDDPRIILDFKTVFELYKKSDYNIENIKKEMIHFINQKENT